MPVSKAKTRHPVSERIHAYKQETGISLRALSVRARLSPSTAQKVCEGLDAGTDVGVATLTKLADAMGRTLSWLLYGGEPPEGIALNTLPGWAEAAREAIERLGVSEAAAEAVGRWRVPEAPPHIDALFVAALARAWEAAIAAGKLRAARKTRQHA